MKYTLTAVRRKTLTKKDGTGTWQKVELKTDKTGDVIYELGYGHSKSLKETAKIGDVVNGYTEQTPWYKSDGSQGGFNNRLQGITAEYVYSLLLKLSPDIEATLGTNTATPAEDSWSTAEPEVNYPDDGF
jgi:hypothetical protein